MQCCFFLLIPILVGGESFVGSGVQRSLIIQSPSLVPDVPEMAEWDHAKMADMDRTDTEFQTLLRMEGDPSYFVPQRFHRESEVVNILTAVCRQCMIAGNIDCVSNLCPAIHAAGVISRKQQRVKDREQVSAFATAVTQQADILCSLCKHTRDVRCTMRYCMNPAVDEKSRESGIECKQDICRWQKTSVVNTGFENRFSAWWHPQSMYLFFDEVSQEIARAYRDLLLSTTKALSSLVI